MVKTLAAAVLHSRLQAAKPAESEPMRRSLFFQYKGRCHGMAPEPSLRVAWASTGPSTRPTCARTRTDPCISLAPSRAGDLWLIIDSLQVNQRFRRSGPDSYQACIVLTPELSAEPCLEVDYYIMVDGEHLSIVELCSQQGQWSHGKEIYV